MKKGNQKRNHWFAHLVNKIICIVKHKKHTKCLNWYIVTFRVKYWFILNLISATYLKQVRTGATKSWKSKRFSKETAGRTFCKWLNQLALFSIKKECHGEAKVLQVKMGQGSLICKKNPAKCGIIYKQYSWGCLESFLKTFSWFKILQWEYWQGLERERHIITDQAQFYEHWQKKSLELFYGESVFFFCPQSWC